MKLKIAFVLVMVGSLKMVAAQSAKDIFNSNVPLTWLGIDFTGAVFNGDKEKLGTEANMKSLMASMNNLMSTEREKFNIGAMVQKNKIEYSIDATLSHNEKLDFSNLYSDKLGHVLHNQDIDAIVRSYDFGGMKGLGLMFNIELFSRLNEEAFVWITFIDLDHKEIIFTERMKGKPSGFGLRNYWAGAIYSIMKKAGSKEFDNWKRKYNR